LSLPRLLLAVPLCLTLAVPDRGEGAAPTAESEREEEPVLNFYNWADYIAPDTISNFEKEFGIKVNYDLFDASEVVEAKLLAGRTGYDLVLFATSFGARLLPIGVFQPLDKSKLPLWGNIDPWVLEQMALYDPDNQYAVPYMWGSTGFAYNVDMVSERMPDAPLDSAAMMFDVDVVSRFADCGVTWLDSPTDLVPLAMLYLGYDANSLEPDELAEVEALLKSVRPYIKYFSSTKMINDLPNEEVCVAMSWAGDYAQARARATEVGRDIDLAYSVPVEGSISFFDGLWIPADAPHPGNAHTFLNYLLRPEVMAANSNETRYANAIPKAIPYMLPELVNDPAAYPPPEVLAKLYPPFMYGPKLERQRTRAHSRIKTGL
jgi:putrescine transport system substrate-binding protein